jgi:hypothetical protein
VFRSNPGKPAIQPLIGSLAHRLPAITADVASQKNSQVPKRMASAQERREQARQTNLMSSDRGCGDRQPDAAQLCLQGEDSRPNTPACAGVPGR